jgi:AraC family transcriptional regulator
MNIFIKNMVCNRCIMVVRQQIEKLELKPVRIELGFVELDQSPTEAQMKHLDRSLRELGFEILDDARRKTIERIKTLLIGLIQDDEIGEHFSLVNFLSQHMNKEYSGLSKLFSEVESITIEQFFILQKIEKVKELLVYNELSLSEISYRMGYSSVAYLSSQFKKVTGQTPGRFRQSHEGKRKPLDLVK